MPDRPDPRDAVFAAELAPERVAGVRRVGDHAACAHDIGDLDDHAPLRVGRMDVEVPGHVTSLGLSPTVRRPITGVTSRSSPAYSASPRLRSPYLRAVPDPRSVTAVSVVRAHGRRRYLAAGAVAGHVGFHRAVAGHVGFRHTVPGRAW